MTQIPDEVTTDNWKLRLAQEKGIYGFDYSETLLWIDENVVKPLASLASQGWVSEKPDLQNECLLITASWISDNEGFSYQFFQIGYEEGPDGWYWAIFCVDGEEWGDLTDLKADLYLVTPSPNQSKIQSQEK